MDKLNTIDASGACLLMGGAAGDALHALRGSYVVECFDAHGAIKWADRIENLITDVGARAMLDGILDNAAKGAVYMGLKGTGSAVVGDTMASHAGWSEVGGTNAPAYSGTRKTPAWSAASGTGAGSRSKDTSSASSFTFTSGGTVAGCFIVIGGTTAQDNTSGTLFSAGDFSGGSRTVVSTDVINVTYTLSI